MMKLVSRVRSLLRVPRKILLTGYPKTGTTVLYHKVKNALPEDAECFFEPENRSIKVPANSPKDILVKSFVRHASQNPNYDRFRHKVVIVRDPRDQLISSLLYSAYNRVINDTDWRGLVDRLIQMLEEKEGNPGAVSMRQIMALYGMTVSSQNGQSLMEYRENHPEAFTVKYEDIVDGRISGLEAFLGLSLEVETEVPDNVKRVERSKKYNGWKSWFLPEDVEYLRPLYQPFMQHFGYEDDWGLSEKASIDPEISSLYVKRIVAESEGRREFLRQRKESGP